METRCLKIKLRPGSLPRVREWAAEINRRQAEAGRIITSLRYLRR